MKAEINFESVCRDIRDNAHEAHRNILISIISLVAAGALILILSFVGYGGAFAAAVIYLLFLITVPLVIFFMNLLMHIRISRSLKELNIVKERRFYFVLPLIFGSASVVCVIMLFVLSEYFVYTGYAVSSGIYNVKTYVVSGIYALFFIFAMAVYFLDWRVIRAIRGDIKYLYGALPVVKSSAAISLVLLVLNISVILMPEKQVDPMILPMESVYYANNIFKKNNGGQSGTIKEKYTGYCRQTIDLYNTEIETVNGRERIKGIDRALCAEAGQNGNAVGYYFHYIVLEEIKGADGVPEVTKYLICAWPETVARTGHTVYIMREDGVIYRRPATADDEGNDPPVTKWPDVDADGSGWRSITY